MERGVWFRNRRRIIGETIDRRAARRPGQLSVHSHGWELFSSDTSSYTHAHPIDFINPDSHLLGKIYKITKHLADILNFGKCLQIFVSKHKYNMRETCSGSTRDRVFFPKR